MPECFVVLRSSRLPIPRIVSTKNLHRARVTTCAEMLPDRGSAALLLIDVINDMDFPKNEQLVQKSGASCQAYRCFETTLQKGGIPTIYVNDHNERFPAYEPPLVITAQARSSEQRKLAKNG